MVVISMYMVVVVTNHALSTVKTTYAIYNMEHVLSVCQDGWEHFAIRVKILNNIIKFKNISALN